MFEILPAQNRVLRVPAGKKTPNLCGIRETKGDCAHALAIGELAHSASITIAKIDRKWHAIFPAVCLQSGRILFSSAEETSDHDSLHTIGTIAYSPTYCTYSSPMIALEYGTPPVRLLPIRTLCVYCREGLIRARGPPISPSR